MPKSATYNVPTSRFILVGEDDPDDQALLQEVFAETDPEITLVFVDTGIQMLSILETLDPGQQPSLLILDYNMPGLNGGDILKAINGNEKYIAIPKILWSTSDSDRFRKFCLDMGALDYIIKPSSIVELKKIVSYMISQCIKNDSKNAV